MADTTTAQPRLQDFFSLAHNYGTLRRPTSTTSQTSDTEDRASDLLSRAAACALVAASAGFGAVFAWGTGSTHGAILGGLSMLFAVALEVCKPLALRNALAALTRLSLIRAAALAILALTAISYSLTAELSLWATLRADGIAVRQSAIDDTANAKTQSSRQDEKYETVRAELASLAPARTSAEVQADITKLFADNPAAGDCSVMDGKVSRKVCPQVDTLKAEAARGERRIELTRELAAAASTPAPTSQSEASVADPAATALATYLQFLGLIVPVNVLGEWLALIPVLALEVGSAFAGLLCLPATRTPIRPAQARCSIDAPEAAARTPAITVVDPVFIPAAEAFTSSTEKLNVSNDPSERLLQLLRTSGGSVFGGQRTFAKAVAISPAHVNGLLHELKAAGKVELNVGKNGTRVKLVA